jgi:hypothetical protein
MNRLLRRVLLLLAMATCTISPGDAQRRFDAGIVAGANFSQVDGDDMRGFHQIGLVAGGRVDTRISRRFRLGLELLYSQMGSRLSDTDARPRFDRIRINYVEVPVSLILKDWAVKDDDGEYFKVEATAGLSYARLISAKLIALSGEDITDKRTLIDNAVFMNFGASVFFSRHFAMHGQWSRAFTDFDGTDAERQISRLVTCRFMYFF